MNTFLLILLACQPGAEPVVVDARAVGFASPEAGPSEAGSSHRGHFSLFGWFRGHSHHKRHDCNGGGANGKAPPVAETQVATPEALGPAVEPPPVEAVAAPVPPPAVGDGAPRQMPRGAPLPARAGPPGN
jgi:hypothetical protein